jgi:hypothetical protein
MPASPRRPAARRAAMPRLTPLPRALLAVLCIAAEVQRSDAGTCRQARACPGPAAACGDPAEEEPVARGQRLHFCLRWWHGCRMDMNWWHQGPKHSHPVPMQGPASASRFCALPTRLGNFQGRDRPYPGAFSSCACSQQAPALNIPVCYLTRAGAAGNFECDMAVRVGRPASKAEVQAMIGGHAKAKAVGVGHRSRGPRTQASRQCRRTHKDGRGSAANRTAAHRMLTAFRSFFLFIKLLCMLLLVPHDLSERYQHFTTGARMPVCMWAPCALRCAERGSWWQQQFCAGSDASAVNIVMTELRDTLALCAPRPRAPRARRACPPASLHGAAEQRARARGAFSLARQSWRFTSCLQPRPCTTRFCPARPHSCPGGAGSSARRTTSACRPASPSRSTRPRARRACRPASPSASFSTTWPPTSAHAPPRSAEAVISVGPALVCLSQDHVTRQADDVPHIRHADDVPHA